MKILLVPFIILLLPLLMWIRKKTSLCPKCQHELRSDDYNYITTISCTNNKCDYIEIK